MTGEAGRQSDTPPLVQVWRIEGVPDGKAYRLPIGWLRYNVIPVRYLESGRGFADLQALKPLFDGAKIVGLCESADAEREFNRLKHRLGLVDVRCSGANSSLLSPSDDLA
jgi:hypothetical protein